MHRTARLIRSGLVAGLLAIAVAIPQAASAAPIVREHYSGGDTWVAEECGLLIETTVAFEGLFMLKSGHAGDPTPYYFDNYKATVVQKNVATGDWITVLQNGLYKDLRIEHVDGTVYEFVAIETGRPFRILDSQGNVVVRDMGLLATRFRVDTLGDDDLSNDVFIESSWELLKDAGSHPGFYADYCETLISLLG
jgi:hypothetical protein